MSDSKRYADDLYIRLQEKEEELVRILGESEQKQEKVAASKKRKKAKEASHSYPSHHAKSGLGKLLERSPIVQHQPPEEVIIDVDDQQLDVDARVSANLELKERMDELDAELHDREEELRQKEEMLSRLSEENKLFRDQIHDLRHQLHYEEQLGEMNKSQRHTEAMLETLYKERHQHAAQMNALETRMMQIMDQNQSLVTNQTLETPAFLQQHDEEEPSSSTDDSLSITSIAQDSEHSESEEIIKPDGRFSDLFLQQLESVDSTNKTITN